MRDEEPRRCFMDGIDWQYHLDGDMRGTTLYPTEEDCRTGNKCIAEGGGCGIVEVEVRIVRWVEEQDIKYEPFKGEVRHEPTRKAR